MSTCSFDVVLNEKGKNEESTNTMSVDSNYTEDGDRDSFLSQDSWKNPIGKSITISPTYTKTKKDLLSNTILFVYEQVLDYDISLYDRQHIVVI